MTTEVSQQPVIDFLNDPANHGGAPVKRVDTHAASVFLAGERALKIKRAVRFPFLDFSTLAKRKTACEAEIAVNRAFAPSIYRGEVPITREPNGQLAIGGKGEPVEWAVEMRRFDESQTLDNLAETGRIDEALADALGRAVAAAHQVAPTGADAQFAEMLAKIIAQNEAELASEPNLFSLQELRALAAATRDAGDDESDRTTHWYRVERGARGHGAPGSESKPRQLRSLAQNRHPARHGAGNPIRACPAWQEVSRAHCQHQATARRSSKVRRH